MYFIKIQFWDELEASKEKKAKLNPLPQIERDIVLKRVQVPWAGWTASLRTEGPERQGLGNICVGISCVVLSCPFLADEWVLCSLAWAEVAFGQWAFRSFAKAKSSLKKLS